MYGSTDVQINWEKYKQTDNRINAHTKIRKYTDKQIKKQPDIQIKSTV